MAYNEEKNLVYMLHVKEKADAGAGRAACSQVRVCGEEMTRSLTIGMEEDILDLFYKSAVAGSKETSSIHNQLVAEEISHFGTQEEFSKVMQVCEFQICLALADTAVNGAQKWKFLKDVDINTDVSKSSCMSTEYLNILKKLGYVSRKKNILTQKLVDRSKPE